MIKLSDYKSPPYTIETIDLKFELSAVKTVVTTKIVGHGNNYLDDENCVLQLNGENQNLIGLELTVWLFTKTISNLLMGL